MKAIVSRRGPSQAGQPGRVNQSQSSSSISAGSDTLSPMGISSFHFEFVRTSLEGGAKRPAAWEYLQGLIHWPSLAIAAAVLEILCRESLANGERVCF
jgi:hypothetical protein